MERVKLWLGLVIIVLMACACNGSTYEEYAEAMPEKVDFNHHIKPILSDKCYACHGPDKNAVKANLRLDIHEGALKKVLESGGYAFVAGNVSKSGAYQRMISEDPEFRMPPPEFNLSLTAYEIALMAKWIDQGAEYKAHWSYADLKMPELPSVKNSDWV